MKKLLSVILALVMLCTCALAADEYPLGVWYLRQAETGGQVVDTAMLGMSMAMILEHTGAVSAYSVSKGESKSDSGRWIMNSEGLVIDLKSDGPMKATYAGDTLTVHVEATGVNLIYMRGQTYEPAAVNAAAVQADYDGLWDCSLVEMDGQQLELSAMGMTLQLTIAQDAVVLSMVQGAEELTMDFAPSMSGNTLLAARPDENVTLSLQLLEDGVILLAAEGGVALYFTPATVPAK